MEKIQLIIFAVLAVFASAMSLDYIIYLVKSAPKTACFSTRKWTVGMLCAMAVVYWYMNGGKFA